MLEGANVVQVPDLERASVTYNSRKRLYSYNDSVQVDLSDVNYEDMIDGRSHVLKLDNAIASDIEKGSPTLVSLNNVQERHYVGHLKMLLRRLGYSSYFTRQNRGRGKAVFYKPSLENDFSDQGLFGSVYRGQQPDPIS